MSVQDESARQIELEIGGMTCASWVNRNKRKLNKLDGISATVNYATEKAKIVVGEASEHPGTEIPA